MPETTAHDPPEIEYLSILDEDGNVDQELEPGIPDDDLVELYREMVFIRSFDEERLSREGCMSVPEYTADLKRYNHIALEWQDLDGRKRTGEFEGLEAVCMQHEVDHLNGRLFLDHVSCLRTDVFPRHFRRRKG